MVEEEFLDLGIAQSKPMQLSCDNQSCMAISKSPIFHARKKHIEIQYHFVRELIMDGEITL